MLFVLLQKSHVRQPGSRGGRFWIDAYGRVRYDDFPHSYERKPGLATASWQTQISAVADGSKPAALFGTPKDQTLLKDLLKRGEELGLKLTKFSVEGITSPKYQILVFTLPKTKGVAEQIRKLVSGKSIVPKGSDEYHRGLGKLLGYTREEIENWIAKHVYGQLDKSLRSRRRKSRKKRRKEILNLDKVLPDQLPDDFGEYTRDEMGRVVGTRGISGLSNVSLP